MFSGSHSGCFCGIFTGDCKERSLSNDGLSPETLKRSIKDKSSREIRPSLTTSKEGLKTQNIQAELSGFSFKPESVFYI